MFYIKHIIAIILCFVGFNLFSQSDIESLGESSFAVNKKVSSDYNYNFSVRSRYYLYQDDAINFENRQLDFVHFSTLNLDYSHSLSLGIQYRLRKNIDGGSNELRLTQQFNFAVKKEAIRFGHRFRFEQRILDALTIFRSRYRFAIDFALVGQKLDVGESYLVASLEALYSASAKIKPEIDQRTTVQIGWLISEQLKLQFGLEYRFEAFNIHTEERLFILTSAILKI